MEKDLKYLRLLKPEHRELIYTIYFLQLFYNSDRLFFFFLLQYLRKLQMINLIFLKHVGEGDEI